MRQSRRSARVDRYVCLRRGYEMFTCIVLLALFASTQGRAVNISNTWVLPEEGFPVFYRYFRDRISWYEADAVCQFHHANLVTVDTTAQYDAVRAYLKELDISSAVWVGLIRSNPDGDFTWTDYRGLSNDGYWSAAPDARAAPLCAAADPAADYRWQARACGGPTVASFICELPVPQWALGNEGCMVRAIPALTVLYLPESAAVQLTADCGLAGVKRVQCTGNVKREELLKELSCNEEEELTSTTILASEGTTAFEAVNMTDLEMTSVSTNEDLTTKNFEEQIQSQTTQQTLNPMIKEKLPSKQQIKINQLNSFSTKNINLDLIHNNNLQSNDIPKLANNNENFLTVEQTEKLEDEKHMHHKMLHDELARHGNFETIFSQPTDHFVPPLVMAKAKLSDDMTVLSLAEKHAQQLAEQRLAKHNTLYEQEIKSTSKPTTEEPRKFDIMEKPLVMNMQYINKDNIKKDKIKPGVPKKYKEKYEDPKARSLKLDGKLMKLDKFIEKTTPPIDISTKQVELSTLTPMRETAENKLKDDSLELTVVLKEPDVAKITGQKDKNISLSRQQISKPVLSTENPSILDSTTKETTRIDSSTVKENVTTEEDKSINITESSTSHVRTGATSTEKAATLSLDKLQTIAMKDIAFNHEIIKITIVKDGDDANPTHTVFEVTTLMPEFKDDVLNVDKKPHISKTTQQSTPDATEVTALVNITSNITSPNQPRSTEAVELLSTSSSEPVTTKSPTALSEKIDTTLVPITVASTEAAITTTVKSTSVSNVRQFYVSKKMEENSTELPTTKNIISTTNKEKTDIGNFNLTEIFDGGLEKNMTDPYAIDDTNSPLLSGANEPLHRPNRMRRPQQPNNLAKFNPFRILG